jgi:signal transduction histidine kinase
MAEQKGIALRHECSPASLPIVGDRRRTLQILLNLATNAVKFTERGAVDIVAHIADARLVVAVRDTGIGIRPDQLPNLFEAFRQLDASARRHYEGTGLGLHLSKKLLEMLGGTISVESASGAGSTFTFVLPLTPP